MILDLKESITYDKDLMYFFEFRTIYVGRLFEITLGKHALTISVDCRYRIPDELLSEFNGAIPDFILTKMKKSQKIHRRSFISLINGILKITDY